MVSISDLRRAFFGAGSRESVTDAEYRQLLALYGNGTSQGQSGIGITLADLVYALRNSGGVYNARSGLSSWKGALTGGRNNVVIYGDSNSWWSYTNTWVNQFRTDILALTGQANGGPGFRHMRLTEWASVGSWTDYSDGAQTIEIGPYGVLASSDPADIFTWTLPGGLPAHDRFDLYGVDDDVLELQGSYSLNGGAFTATAWDMGPDTGVRLVKQTIVTPITTTLRLRGAGSGASEAFYVGAAFYQGTTGLVVHNLARSGAKVDFMTGVNAADRLKIVDDLQPKLSIIWSGGAELYHGGFGAIQLPLDTYYTRLKQIVDRCRLYGDVLMISSSSINEPNPITPNPALRPNTYDEFELKAKQIAQETDSAYFSFREVFGTWAQMNARNRMADDAHFNAAGAAAVAKTINQILTEFS